MLYFNVTRSILSLPSLCLFLVFIYNLFILERRGSLDIVEDNKYEKDDKKKDDKKKDDKKKDDIKKDDKKKDRMEGEGDSTKVDSNDSPPRLEVHFLL